MRQEPSSDQPKTIKNNLSTLKFETSERVDIPYELRKAGSNVFDASQPRDKMLMGR